MFGRNAICIGATAASGDDTLLPFDLPAFSRKSLAVDVNGDSLQCPTAAGATGAAPACGPMPDRRGRNRIRHVMFEMLMARVSAIACGYEDAIDLDRLRHGPLMKVAVGRCPEALASQRAASERVFGGCSWGLRLGSC